ncbi:MAG: DUF2330 domain-containing protein, partial [Myxococcales bacterium]|nr:DUF2330 domain-containing protein [Myxococcales bacterium]
MTRSLRLATVVAAASLVSLVAASEASACGGTFCDTGPTAMPVDQSGENIIFHIGPDQVEAHIQIQYDPDTTAEAFAWLIPVSAMPEFEVGSQLLFDATLNGSVPSYGMFQQSDSCGQDVNLGGEDDVGGTTGQEDAGSTGTGGEQPNVYQTTVGAFDIAVLDGGTVDSIMQWLGDNGYQQDPNAAPIIEQYLGEGFMFVAMKLSNDADIGEIHPIVIRYGGTEPCVPIRLTSIAALEDMDIRVFFYQDGRTVPVNYRHVLVNPLMIDWFNNADNYKEVISLAVDADQANGHAFVTEYAGPSLVVNTFQIYSPAWNGDVFTNYVDSPVGVIEELTTQGLISCDPIFDADCSYNHPLLQPILAEFIPVPAGVTALDFYGCLSCYAADIDLVAWDAAAFAAAIDERIVVPANTAKALVEGNTYLTRMYTTISPSEMNEDPIFRINSTLPDVPNVRFATQTTHCNDTATVVLPDGREVFFANGLNPVWPDFPDEMPWVEDVDQEGMAENAPLINLVDNTELINSLLDEHNAQEQAKIPDLFESGCYCSSNGDDQHHWLFGFAA